MVKEKKLFLVRCNLHIYPSFYVEAVDILEATKLAKDVVEQYGHGKQVGVISTVDVPLLSLEGEDVVVQE